MRNPFFDSTNFSADWRLMRVYVQYRGFLAVLLLGLYMLPGGKGLVGEDNPELFLSTSVAYLILTVGGVILSRRQERDLLMPAFMRLVLDIIALTLMVHASGGLTPQFAMLFLVTVAAGNILLTGRWGALIAAVAAFMILYEQFYFAVSQDFSLSPKALAQTSLLGLSFFAVALFSQLISLRMREGEALAAQRAEDIVGLQTLNAQIIQRMRTGILVVDHNRRLLLINDSARLLLALPAQGHIGQPLKSVSGLLEAGVHAWRQNPTLRPIPFRNREGAATITASFALLGGGDEHSNVLVFLEDTAQMAQQAQQLKLASLGRLAASIAHEVRNPLGAISHATQLLAESPQISGSDKRLLDIIQQHCLRMNGIIENVLQLSRRRGSNPELFNLQGWIANFNEEFNSGRAEPAQITLEEPATPLLVRFDPQQLYQVVTNLVANGLRYSRQVTGRNEIVLSTGHLALDELPYLDIIDSGPGIPAAAREHLFEPFYTTENTGTGLGLYLSRELCEANQARLDCLAREDQSGACFRITFAHPDRLS